MKKRQKATVNGKTADVPDDWIEATIGYLSKTNQTYKVKIKVLNNSEVTFEDYEEQQ